MQRRKFVSAAAGSAAAASAFPAGKPVIDGGTPVRSAPLRAGFWGTQFYDDKERAELMDVLEAQAPCRWYGSKPPTKVLQFEKEFAARMQAK